MGRNRGLDPNARVRVNELLSAVEIDDSDKRRLQVVPDDDLAKAFKFLLMAEPGAKDADVLRRLIYDEVLRLGALLGEGGKADDLPQMFRRIEERLTGVEERCRILERVFVNPQAEIE